MKESIACVILYVPDGTRSLSTLGKRMSMMMVTWVVRLDVRIEAKRNQLTKENKKLDSSVSESESE